MCNSCLNINQYDPTRTLQLRRSFVSAMNKRFRALRGVIRTSIDENDCFGLRDINANATKDMNPIPSKAFGFRNSRGKIEAFMEWLREQAALGILDIRTVNQLGRALEESWTNTYIESAYKRGIERAYTEMNKAGYTVPTLASLGGIDAVFNAPVHADRVGILYTRVFSDLKGITDAMDTQISRVLAQGMIDGKNPKVIARELTRTISGPVGDLGLTDTLGRFMPAERRAQTLARTEIIRAHHMGLIQEYRNYSVLGIRVKAEWLTAGDRRVCPDCQSLEGSIWTLDQIEGMIPAHANCFIDRQVPIYTSKGWKPIGDIEIGDNVLTHKKRFRKVYALPRKNKQKPRVVKFRFIGGKTVTMTENHPVLITEDEGKTTCWLEANRVTKKHKIMYLGNKCKRCEKPIPYYNKYCSKSCNSKDITDRQWADPEHRKNMSKKATEQLKREYKEGIRDKNSITNKANEKVRQLVKQNKWNHISIETMEKMLNTANSEEARKKSSKRMKQKNPMSDPIIKEKAIKSIEKYYRNNPERRLNARMAKLRKSGKMTSIEKKMSEILDSLGVDYIFQYPILGYDTDFAIPDLNVVIECDGLYWHKGNEEKDKKRQKKIEKEGWQVFRFTDVQINKDFDNVKKEVSRIICNHVGEYNLVPMEIKEIKKWVIKKPRMLYNLSVEEDESYIAKGAVVHNCRCLAIPIPQGS